MSGRATIYVVRGSSGEYSDRNEWPVAAYLDEPSAEKHVAMASDRALAVHPDVEREWERRQDAGDWTTTTRDIYRQMMGDLDPDPYCAEYAGQGVRYWYERTPLLEHVPEPLGLETRATDATTNDKPTNEETER